MSFLKWEREIGEQQSGLYFLLSFVKLRLKFIFLLLFVSGIVTASFSQVLSNSGAVGNITNGTVVNGGTVTITSGTLSNAGALTLSADLTNNGTINGNGVYTIGGNFVNNSVFTAGTSTVTFNGSSAQSIGGATSTSFYDIVQNNSSGVSLAQHANLTDALIISAGTFTSTSYSFTLVSNASGTARIGPIPSGADFTGNIIMQRYSGNGITRPTGWRFLSSAVSGATITQWADDFVTSGFTGSTDPANSFISIYTYDETVTGTQDNGYVAATDVTNSISNGKGFWVYLGPTPVTFSVTGPPNTFTFSPTVTFTSSAGALDDGWNLVPNPYPSAIDWNSASWTKTNINNAIYIYNDSTGSFASYVAGVGVNGGSQYIASQQAFWVQSNAASPSLKMVENVKTSLSPNYLKTAPTQNISHYPMVFKDFPVPLNANTIPNSIKFTASGNGYDDETFIRFMQGASTDFDGNYDAWKMKNRNTFGPNISSVVNDSLDLSINSLPYFNSNTTVKIRITVPIAGTYSIRRDSMLMMPMSSCLFLEDLANGNMIDLRSTISYSFTISDTTKAPRFLLHIFPSISKTSINVICASDSTGIAIAKGTGTGPWNYIWKDAGGNTLQIKNNSTAADTLFHLPVGIYVIQVAGGICGTTTDTIPIKAKSNFVLSSNFSNASCYGFHDGTVIAISTGGLAPYTYLWNSGATTSALNNLAAGNYSVVATDAVGCSNTQSYVISQPAILVSGFTANTYTLDLSVGNSVTFSNNSLGALTYLWDFGDTTSLDTAKNPTHNYCCIGTHTVTLIASNGICSDTLRKIIFVINTMNPTSVSQHGNSSFVNVVYDNGGVYLSFDLPKASDANINIYNLLGEKIAENNSYQIQKCRIKLDVGNISAGVYIAVVSMPDAVISKKIIISSK